MLVDTKQCKQCGRILELDKFRKYSSRSRTKKEGPTGCNTVCKDCESINMKAYNLSRNTNLTQQDLEMLDKIKQHYTALMERGYPPVTAAARKLMNYEQPDGPASLVRAERSLSAFGEIANYTKVLTEHIQKIKDRSYASFDEADAKHKELVDKLRGAGLYEQATDLLDEWFMEE